MDAPDSGRTSETRASAERLRAELLARLDYLEFHRAFDIHERLVGATEVQSRAATIGATDLEMRARLVEADMRLRVGAASDAARLATEVNRWATENHANSLLARSHLILSSIFESIGDSASCLDHAIGALELLEDDASPRTRGNFILRLADALCVSGSFEAARERYREAQSIFVSIGDVERQISVLNNLAYAEFEAGNSEQAWTVAVEMRQLAENRDFPLAPPHLDTLARALMGVGRGEEAKELLEAALKDFAVKGDVEANTPGGVMLTLAEVQLAQGRPDLAQKTIDICFAVCDRRNLGAVRVEALRVQAQLQAAAGDFEAAYGTHKAFHAEYLRLNSIRRESESRTRQALFEIAEARHTAQRFWRQARTDALTGLPNRRFVDEELPRRIEQVARGLPLAVAIVDVDNFKLFNDSYSHQVGDRVIFEVGRVLQGALPASADPEIGARFVARLGGEEYLLVLSDVQADAAARLLKRIRRTVASHDWSGLIGPMPLTVSIGGTMAVAADTQSLVLARADRHMYAAKAAGRDRVVVDQAARGRMAALQALHRHQQA